MKKLLTVLVCLCLVLGLSIAVFAAENEVTYSFSGGTLTISGNGPIPNYSSWDTRPWEAHKNAIRKVVIKEGITAVGEYTFYDYPYLTSVEIAGSVEKIGSSAFKSCDTLSTVILKEGLKTIDYDAFLRCGTLREITIPGTVETIGTRAFQGCSGMSKVVIGDGVKTLKQECFQGCSGITELTLPGSIENMESYVFSDCSSLRKLVLKEGITYVSDNAFPDCALESVSFPKSLKSIGVLAFSGNAIKEVVLPEGFTSLSSSAFYNNAAMTKVVLPSTLTDLDSNAFYGCAGLKTVDIPASVSTIGDGAFANCSALETVKLHDGLTIIGGEAFVNCSALKEIVIPGTVAEVGGGAFQNCDALTRAVVSDGVIILGGGAFSYSDALKDVYLSNTLTSIGESAFYSCGSLKHITIPASVNSIGRIAFTYSGLQSAVFEEGFQKIDFSAFNTASDLIYVVIPESLSSVGLHAFADCDSLCHVLVTGGERDISVDESFGSNDTFLNATWHYHATGKEITIEDTCTEVIASCSICKDIIFSEAKKNAQHTFGEWTNAGNGEDQRTCSGCGTVEKRKSESGSQKENPFSDVQEGKFYYESVLWAVDEGITTGYKDGTFKPSKTCTRAEVVTFLWRAAGKPAPISQYNPFTDVPETAYYYDAVLWAVEKGITLGKTLTTFEPSATCTRGQIVTFLWRYNGRPIPGSMSNPFPDVSLTAYYGTAVLWAVDEGITTGYRDGTFGPGNYCTRDQIVTFLYRSIME